MTKALLAAALLVAGCGGLQVDMAKVAPPPPHADEALHAVLDMYGVRAVPTVYWYGGAALDCNGGTSYIDSTGYCASGEELGGVIIVAAPSGMLIGEMRDQFNYARLAHEVEHFAAEQRGDEDGCINHACPQFAPGAEVDRATQMLLGMDY